MGRRRPARGPFARALAVAIVIVAARHGAASAVDSRGLRAELGGNAISVRDVANFHCHDRDFPVIRCFDTPAPRDRELAQGGSDEGDVSSSAAMAVHYVTWYADAGYAEPPSFAAFWPEPNLAAYGWNDKISSFRTYNGGHPKWWQDVGYGGTAWDWGTISVSYVGNSANDQFSSVEAL